MDLFPEEEIKNPSQRLQNELNPNLPDEFKNLSKTDLEFARLVYIEEKDPKDAYCELGLHIYKNDYFMMNKYKKYKGETKSDQQINLGVNKILKRVQAYGEYLKNKIEEEYKKSESYSKEVAIETCLTNIQIARDTVQINSKLFKGLDKNAPDYLRQAQKLNNIIAQGQKTILEYLKELNRLQHLYNKDGGEDDKVTLVFNDNVER